MFMFVYCQDVFGTQTHPDSGYIAYIDAWWNTIQLHVQSS